MPKPKKFRPTCIRQWRHHRGLTLETVAELPNLTAELLSRGYREQDLTQILGGNYLRVFEQVFGR